MMNPLAFAYILAGFLTVADSGTKLEKVPEPILMEGLSAISNCVAVDIAGVKRLAALAQNTENEPNNLELAKMQIAANALLTAIASETKVGIAIVSALMTEYKHSKEELQEKLKTQMDETKDDLKNSFDKAMDYDELEDVITPKLENCDKALIHWADEVEKYADPDDGFSIKKHDDDEPEKQTDPAQPEK